jgi:trimethylamine--corrinoid protein Co-methyltransferase
VWVVVAPQSGATAPAALAGALVQCVAEAIAGLLLVDLVAPGHPVILGPWPFVSDLRTGSFTGGNAEEAIVSAAAAQVINALGLVSSVGAGMSDAKSPDAQAGYEKGIAVALAALAGCNNVSESAGMVGSLMGLSLEALVIDNEMLGQVMRAVRGIEVTEETLSFDVIAVAVRGDGHFLRQPQTLELMRSEYHYPLLADRSTPAEWNAAGSPDIRVRAREVLGQIMSSHYPQYIDPDVDYVLRELYPIRLAGKDMRCGGGRW